jgi:hypothetical protein
MPATYEPITTTTLTASAGVTFSSISQSYTDLVLVANGVESAGAYFKLNFNGDTSSNYSRTIFRGNGSSVTAARAANEPSMYPDFDSTSTVIINIMNYTNATTFKTVLWRANSPTALVGVNANLWRKTPEAITSIAIASSAGGGTITGTFTLYGIKAA